MKIERNGFTLLETLVALTIATILIAALIPISRNTLFRAANLAEQADALAVLERISHGHGPITANRNDTPREFDLRITKSSLPQFSYPRDERNPWQPVLYKIEARGKWASVTQTEIIRLERALP